MTTQPPLVIGVGELLWDVFDETRRPGGAPANVAFQANQLGLKGMVFSRVGVDQLGDDLLAFLDQHGLTTSLVQRDPVHLTGIASVEETAAGPQFVFRSDSAWDFLEFGDSIAEALREAGAVCFGTLAQRSERSRDTIHACLDAAPPGCLRVYDVNLRAPWYEADWIEASLARAQIVKVNESETVELARLLETEAQDPAGFARELLTRNDLNLVCVTRGAEGCLLATAEATAEVAGRPIDVVDTVGAGDAFTAALIRGRLAGWPLEAIAEFANEAGALTASRPGAMPPLREEFASLLSRFEPR